MNQKLIRLTYFIFLTLVFLSSVLLLLNRQAKGQLLIQTSFFVVSIAILIYLLDMKK